MYEPLVPQPSRDSLMMVHRYYATLKRDKGFRRRISSMKRHPVALVEYLGVYPEIVASHGNATR